VRTRKAVRPKAEAVEPSDLETRVNDAHHQGLKLWLRLLACTNKIENEIRGRLRSKFDTTLPRFDLMAQLERNPAGLKMNELSQRLMVTGGNVTGITDQLEKEGLVLRASDPSDRRAFTVKLTPDGRAVFTKMAAVHEQWVIELFAGLNAAEKDQVYRLLARLKVGLLKPGLAAQNSKEEKRRWTAK
jgi:DNA-binding MarR family transcriptional regulator